MVVIIGKVVMDLILNFHMNLAINYFKPIQITPNFVNLQTKFLLKLTNPNTMK